MDCINTRTEATKAHSQYLDPLFILENNRGAKLRSLSINLPFGLGGATIEINENQKKAAWALYVELATWVATEELKPAWDQPARP